jgi:hypothetical protein
VRYHLRKLKDYRSMVTRILLTRVQAAGKAYTVTRTRENRRRMKHSLAMLRQKRPLIYARILDSGRPKQCGECSRPIKARTVPGMWGWSCGWCGASDFVPFRAVDLAARRNGAG